ncbi:MAG: LamG domain-containing protein [Fuerstiella sp.]|nr:LamG domain-containing protein [Fuerstiella sp.]
MANCLLFAELTISLARFSSFQSLGGAEFSISEGTSNRIQSLAAGRSAVVNAEGDVVRIEGKALDPRHQDTSGLLAHWNLDDIGGDGHVADASGNGLHGTLNRNTQDSSMEGKVGRALDLGNRGFVDLSQHIPVLTDTTAYTLTAWVCDANDIVFSVSDGTPRDRVQFELQGNWLYYGWQKGDRFDHIRARVSDWERGRWYHIAVSVSGGTVTIYRDGRALITPRSHGEVITTRLRAPIDVDQPTHAYLGFLVANHAQQKQFLGGKIDDVQFYGRALDEQAVRFLFEHPGETYSRSPASKSNDEPDSQQ